MLVVRDFGVDGAEADVALERVRRGLAVVDLGTRRDERFPGLGIGLSLCQLQFAQFQGWVAAHRAGAGPGLAVVLVFATGATDGLPADEPGPEAWASRAAWAA